MASPIGHALSAVLTGRLGSAAHQPVRVWLSLAIFATIAPDLDFLPGLLVGDINRFHHGASHSLGAAVIFGGLAALVAGATPFSRFHLALAAGALYGSHLVLDFLTADTRPPFGQPLLWPLTSEHFAIKRPILYGIRHASADGGLVSFMWDVLSVHNFKAVLREILVIGPPVLLVWIALGRRAATRARPVAAPVRRRGGTSGHAPDEFD